MQPGSPILAAVRPVGAAAALRRMTRERRVDAIVSDALATGSPRTVDELRAMITAPGPASAERARVVVLKKRHDDTFRALAKGRFDAVVVAPGGAPLRPDASVPGPVLRAFRFVAAALAAGVDPALARQRGNACLVAEGFHGLVLEPEEEGEHLGAATALRESGDASGLLALWERRLPR